MELLLPLFLNGVVNGAHYALLAMGFGMIFATTGVVHFAYGPVYAVAAYLTWWSVTVLSLPFLVAMGVGIVGCAVVGMASYVLLYRWFLRNDSPPFIILVVSLGLLMLITNLIGVAFGTNAKTVNDVTYGFYFIGSAVVTGVQLWQVLALVVVGLGLAAFMKWTAYGSYIRAMQDNMLMAKIVGINTERVSLVVFGIGSGISGIAASLILVKEGALPHMGFLAVFYAFLAAVVGGLGSLPGAVAGGLILGLVESLGVWRVSSDWQTTIAFGVLFIVLIWRPTGLWKGY
ncbi:branched-chain amino acid ABC transporter permease [Roseovarius amoyensis]|uniref:branched-chain amino acid ABC transporter permease n=1 Tax=Roseovarius amoyensis TaxID=2211448 RepID=UPI000DBE0239|nr:branched-chain amino acid ABC transporter permease [Roseovarius amoyensis]